MRGDNQILAMVLSALLLLAIGSGVLPMTRYMPLVESGATLVAAFGGAWAAFKFESTRRAREESERQLVALTTAFHCLLDQFDSLLGYWHDNIRSTPGAVVHEKVLGGVFLPGYPLAVDLPSLRFLVWSDELRANNDVYHADRMTKAVLDQISHHKKLLASRAQTTVHSVSAEAEFVGSSRYILSETPIADYFRLTVSESLFSKKGAEMIAASGAANGTRVAFQSAEVTLTPLAKRKSAQNIGATNDRCDRVLVARPSSSAGNPP